MTDSSFIMYRLPKNGPDALWLFLPESLFYPHFFYLTRLKTPRKLTPFKPLLLSILATSNYFSLSKKGYFQEQNPAAKGKTLLSKIFLLT